MLAIEKRTWTLTVPTTLSEEEHVVGLGLDFRVDEWWGKRERSWAGLY
jgi:hypothetical protein